MLIQIINVHKTIVREDTVLGPDNTEGTMEGDRERSKERDDVTRFKDILRRRCPRSGEGPCGSCRCILGHEPAIVSSIGMQAADGCAEAIKVRDGRHSSI